MSYFKVVICLHDESNARVCQVFAVAAFDENDDLIGNGVGATCAPVATLNPLPLTLCWAQVSQTALALGFPSLAGQVSVRSAAITTEARIACIPWATNAHETSHALETTEGY